jgi:hypothetical protein
LPSEDSEPISTRHRASLPIAVSGGDRTRCRLRLHRSPG